MAQRRLSEELGISTSLKYMYEFIYQARFNGAGSENELCSVFIGRSNSPVTIDKTEIAAWRYVNFQDLESDLNEHPDRFTPWFIMQWQQLRRQVGLDAIDFGLS